MKLILFTVACLVLLIPAASQARTWLVRQDGTGDCTTIQACVNLAIAGDSVLVSPGTYQEHVTISTAILLIGQAGNAATIIDGKNTGRCILLNHASSPGVVIAGFTIRNGELMEYPGSFETSNGAGIFAKGSTGLVADCVLERNAGMSIGCDETSNMTIEHNLMQLNFTTYIEPPYPVGGGGVITRSSNVIVRENTFINNDGDDFVAQACSPQILRNKFLGPCQAIVTAVDSYIAENLITGSLAPVALYGTPRFIGNTVVNNRFTGIYVGPGAAPVISNNIVTGNSTGINCEMGYPSLSCNDVWNNVTNYVRCTGTTDFHLDPQFCNASGGDFRLNCTSPCVNYPGCGQVGAFGVGCGATAVQESTWGKIKVLFR